MCYEHHREMTTAINEFIEQSMDPNFEDALQVCTVASPEECSREEMLARKFYEFAEIVGITRLIPRKDYSEYKKDTQRKKVDGAIRINKYLNMRSVLRSSNIYL